MPIPIDYREIITMLLHKTDNGLVYWRKGKFVAASVLFEEATFSLWAGNDEHTEEPFVAFALQDEDGATLDSWYVEQNDGTDYTLMHRLYTAAKRHIAGVPEKLRALREKIEHNKEVGIPPDQ